MATADNLSIILEDGKSTPCAWCADIISGSLDQQIAHCAKHKITERAAVEQKDGKDYKVWLVHPSANT